MCSLVSVCFCLWSHFFCAIPALGDFVNPCSFILFFSCCLHLLLPPGKSSSFCCTQLSHLIILLLYISPVLLFPFLNSLPISLVYVHFWGFFSVDVSHGTLGISCPHHLWFLHGFSYNSFYLSCSSTLAPYRMIFFLVYFLHICALASGSPCHWHVPTP